MQEGAVHIWGALLNKELHSREPGAPLQGLRRGGYRLVYRDHRNDFCKSYDALAGSFDTRFSLGLTIADGGTVQEVMWDSAAFAAGVTAGALVEKVNGSRYSGQALGDAIDEAVTGRLIALTVRARPQARSRQVAIDYQGGHRFPHLEKLPGVRLRLDDILAARS